MILTARAIGFLLTIALATGGAAWGVHALLSPAQGEGSDYGPETDGPAPQGEGSDYGLDTDGNGQFEWLVVEADVNLPEAGTWDVYADLAASSPPDPASCGFFGKPPPVPLVQGGAGSYPIAWTYERYFFPAGAQTVRMAFPGEQIDRAGVDGPYAVHAVLSLGGYPYPYLERPVPIREPDVLEWNYTTAAYSTSAFESALRPAFFTGAHSDRAVDVDGDGLADVLELTAGIHVNIAGNYSLYGTLSEDVGSDVVRMFVYASRMIGLDGGDTQASLRFRGDQIRSAGVDGPWRFALTLFPFEYPHAEGNARPPADGSLWPGIFPYPEMLCGTTGAYRAADFDDTPEFLQYTNRFEEATPDFDGDGLHDALVVRAEVDVLAAAAFDVVGTLRSPGGSRVVAQVSTQIWFAEGVQWAEFSFPGPAIRASGVDGPYEATLSLTPIEGGRDPTTTYTTAAYRAAEFDDAVSGPRMYRIGDLAATPSDGSLAISVRVVRGPDPLTVVIEDVLVLTVTDASGVLVGTFKERVYLPGLGSEQAFSFAVPEISAGRYTVTAVLGPPDRPVDTRTIDVTV